MKKVTSFTHHTTAEGERISFTFSEIDETGNVIKSNERTAIIALDENVLGAIKTINDFLTERL